jgi:hypothetical protein
MIGYTQFHCRIAGADEWSATIKAWMEATGPIVPSFGFGEMGSEGSDE